MAGVLAVSVAGCASGPQRLKPAEPPPYFLIFDPSELDNPRGPYLVDRFDWTGHLAGRWRLPGIMSSQSPDGAYVIIQNGDVISAAGTKVLHLKPRDWAWRWADDSRHLCALLGANQAPLPDGPAVPAQSYLYVTSVNGVMAPPHPIAASSAHFRPVPAACSVASDRAILITSMGWMEGVYRLSDGGAVPFPADRSVSAVRASADGRLLAEQSPAQTSQLIETVIREGPSGSVVTRIPRDKVVQFSGDGTRAVVSHQPGCAAPTVQCVPPEVRIIELASGRVIWTAVGRPLRTITRPGGAELVVVTIPPATWQTQEGWHTEDIWQAQDVWLIDARGNAVKVGTTVPVGTS